MSDFISLNSIQRHFGVYHALKGITLELQPGRIGLLGPNGAGKSTLLKILMGLLSPSLGSGTVLGIPLRAGNNIQGNMELRRLIGFMSEADSLVPGLKGVEYVTLAGELCGMPRRQAQRRAHEILTYLEMEDARYRKLEEYSTGMKQRIKLAQALIHDPPVLLLDEPTSGLDPAGRDAMLRLMLEIGRDFGKSIIVSTHLLADVETVCDQVVLLINGQIRGQGTVEELCSRRQDRYRLQIQGDREKFAGFLRDQGVEVLDETIKGEVRIQVSRDWAPQQGFELARKSQVVLRGIIPDDETLEELFLRSVEGAETENLLAGGKV
ncbi:ABC transporter ATP-binding protein [Telmatocola sphagniphila]|uniref:ABC transporter ATP-binding protein n=1 Tax=Telmatocola sphagniphila TaxID=1123043 RepID=A0A8E6EWC9_9BACT|nr:ABC transporter ATP-binding protein [Telmatocola sphagniphila]QVL33667.1 ABC transporter ATP-binding protein [Telmatocola sphagniphila]